MKIGKFFLLITATAAMLASCALMPAGSSRSAEFDVMEEMAEAPMMESSPAEAPMVEKAGADSGFTQDTGAAERIVIRNANLSIVVTDPAATMEEIADMAEDRGGFVVNSNLYKTTTSSGAEVPTANITIRVPVEDLDMTLEKIKGLVEDPDIDILSEDISGQDVTKEVTDLESRLRNLEAAEEQLLEIMEDATETEAVIEVFRELTNVREEIEVIKGQIQYYRESAALSAISVTIQAKEAVEPISIGGWQPGVQVQNALQALVNAGKYLVNFLIWLVIFAAPVLAIIFLPIYLIIRFVRKKKKSSEKKEPEKKE